MHEEGTSHEEREDKVAEQPGAAEGEPRNVEVGVGDGRPEAAEDGGAGCGLFVGAVEVAGFGGGAVVGAHRGHRGGGGMGFFDGFVGGRDDEGEEDTGGEGGQGEDEEGEGTETSAGLHDLVDVFVCAVGIFQEEWLSVDSGDVSRSVEEEGKPCDPCEELNTADGADLRRETTNRVVQSFEEAKDTS